MNEYLETFLSSKRGKMDFHLFESRLANGSYESPFEERRELCRKFSWAIPTDDALKRIADLGPIVEIGAGTGYWAYLLREMGVDVVAYDIHPPGGENCRNGWHEGSAQWTPVVEGGPEKAHEHETRALFLCWPPYDMPMAHEALKAYRGSTVVYIGEGGGGCTGDEAFHDLLHAEWDEEWHELPQWDGIHDGLHIYSRK